MHRRVSGECSRSCARSGAAASADAVYLARQVDLDRDVALKELAGLHASDPAFVEHYLRESRVAGSLNHPNIVTVHEYFEHEGTAYIAMEYFERGSLRGAAASPTLSRSPESSKACSPASLTRTRAGSSIAISSPRT